MMISKELLSEVLFDSRVSIDVLNLTRDNSLNYSIFASINERDGTNFNYDIPTNYYVEKRYLYDDINIYELAHKCKEWALTIGYHITTLIYDDNANRVYTHGLATVHYSDNNSNYVEVFSCEASTEPEAVFLACQWILEL